MRSNLSLKAALAAAFGLLALICAGQGALSVLKLAGSQAAMGTSEVTSNIAGVAGAAEEAGAAASQVLSTASELSRQAETLAAEVGRFLATVRAA